MFTQKHLTLEMKGLNNAACVRDGDRRSVG
jgi:hypothetical protein